MKPDARDPLRPFLGFFVFALLYFIGINLLTPAMRFLGGEMAANTLSTLVTAAIVNTLAFAIFEQRSLVELGLNWAAGSMRNLMIGILLSAFAGASVILGPMALGLVHFEPVPNAEVTWRAILFTPILLFCGAAGEELAFRGFPLQFLMRGYGPWISILGIGGLFGALHATNPNSSPVGIANTAGFGIVFGYALLRSQDLWFPIGLHFGWNTVLPFLGAELSGLTIRVAGYKLAWNAGDLWSGGKYGPEASLVTTGILVLLALAVWKVPVKPGYLVLLNEPEPESGPVPPLV